MFPGSLHYEFIKSLDPPQGAGDRVRRTRQRPIGIRVRRKPDSTDE
jgi:hypothetical protein